MTPPLPSSTLDLHTRAAAAASAIRAACASRPEWPSCSAPDSTSSPTACPAA